MWTYIIFTGLVIFITIVMIRRKNITIKKKYTKENESPTQKVISGTMNLGLKVCGEVTEKIIKGEMTNDIYKDTICNYLDDIGNVYKDCGDHTGLAAAGIISYVKPSIKNFMENTICVEKSVDNK